MSTTDTTLEFATANSPTSEVQPRTPSLRGEPTWELAERYPRQGEWTEEEYLALDSNRLIEFTDGVLEFLPMPKPSHGLISRFLADHLRAHVNSRRLGDVFWAPISVRLRPGIMREPDVFFVTPNRIVNLDDAVDGADLVVEIVSAGGANRARDYRQKRSEYAEAGIAEYWIVDPETETITVLTLPAAANEYTEHGIFRAGESATSVLLPEFTVGVAACFAAGKGQA